MAFIRKILIARINHSEKRVTYLDFIRGILIISVLYHHSGAPFNSYILQFHMPALFVLSGYTEYILNREKPFASYVKAKAIRLIFPYFCFEIINLILFAILRPWLGKADLSIGDALISIITCINNSYIGLYGRLWFLPAIFVSSINSYLVKKLAKGKPYIIGIICILMLILSYVSSEIIPHRLPFTVDTAFLGTAFFLMGHLSGHFIKNIFEHKNRWRDLLLLAIFGGLFAWCNKIANPTCLMYINQYKDFPFMIICAISGTILCLILAKYLYQLFDKISVIKEVVLWYSVNSLAVFPVHLTIKVLSIPFLSFVGLNNWPVLLAITLILTIPIVNIINIYFPFMLGHFVPKK